MDDLFADFETVFAPPKYDTTEADAQNDSLLNNLFASFDAINPTIDPKSNESIVKFNEQLDDTVKQLNTRADETQEKVLALNGFDSATGIDKEREKQTGQSVRESQDGIIYKTEIVNGKQQITVDTSGYRGDSLTKLSDNLYELLKDANKTGANISIKTAPGQEQLVARMDQFIQDKNALNKNINDITKSFPGSDKLPMITNALQRNFEAQKQLDIASEKADKVRVVEEGKAIARAQAIGQAEKNYTDALINTNDVKGNIGLSLSEFAAGAFKSSIGNYETLKKLSDDAIQRVIAADKQINSPFSFSKDFNIFGRVMKDAMAKTDKESAISTIQGIGQILNAERAAYHEQFSRLKQSVEFTPELNKAQREELIAKANVSDLIRQDKLETAIGNRAVQGANRDERDAQKNLERINSFENRMNSSIQSLMNFEERKQRNELIDAQRAEMAQNKIDRDKIKAEAEQQKKDQSVQEDKLIREALTSFGIGTAETGLLSMEKLDKQIGKSSADMMRKLISDSQNNSRAPLGKDVNSSVEMARRSGVGLFRNGVLSFDSFKESPEYRSAEQQLERRNDAQGANADQRGKAPYLILQNAMKDISTPNNPYYGDVRRFTEGLNKSVFDRLSSNAQLAYDNLRTSPLFSYLGARAKETGRPLDDVSILNFAADFVDAGKGSIPLSEVSQQLSQYYTLQAAINNIDKQFLYLGMPEQNSYSVSLQAFKPGTLFGTNTVGEADKNVNLMDVSVLQRLIQKAQKDAYFERLKNLPKKG